MFIDIARVPFMFACIVRVINSITASIVGALTCGPPSHWRVPSREINWKIAIQCRQAATAAATTGLRAWRRRVPVASSCASCTCGHSCGNGSFLHESQRVPFYRASDLQTTLDKRMKKHTCIQLHTQINSFSTKYSKCVNIILNGPYMLTYITFWRLTITDDVRFIEVRLYSKIT